MRTEIEIPKEFEGDYNAGKFDDFFGRVIADMIYYENCCCGIYELETAQMLKKAFAESKEAYDVEAVVAELEKERKKCWCANEIRVMKKAIETVRNGGKE